METIMSIMSSATTSTQGISRQSRTGALLATLQRWWVAYITWRLEQAAIARLCSMSDRELRDIGITRSGIPNAVMVRAEFDRTFRRCN
jgi:uncharacterized protein YjiS (DUF1127 family)